MASRIKQIVSETNRELNGVEISQLKGFMELLPRDFVTHVFLLMVYFGGNLALAWVNAPELAYKLAAVVTVLVLIMVVGKQVINALQK